VLATSDRLQTPKPSGGARDRIAVCGIAGRLARRKLCRNRRFMRSDPALEVSDTIVVMAPALITRGGAGGVSPIRSPSAMVYGYGRLRPSSQPRPHPAA
jgi:hypothetical protein